MYGTFEGPRHGGRSVTILAALLLAAPGAAQGQEGPPPATLTPEVRAVVPGQVILEEGAKSLSVELVGLFPPPSHRLLSRLSVTVAARGHSCRLGWSAELIRSLLDGSGQPWLTPSDLLNEVTNDERRHCGTIDGMWEDRIELMVNHPALRTTGTLRFGVGLSSEPAPDGSPPESTFSDESWGEMSLVPPFQVLAHTPRLPLARAGEALRFNFVVASATPTSVEVAVDGGWVSVSFVVEGERVTIDVPPQLYRAPAHLEVRLSAEEGSTTVSIPVCAGDARTGVRCPQS